MHYHKTLYTHTHTHTRTFTHTYTHTYILYIYAFGLGFFLFVILGLINLITSIVTTKYFVWRGNLNGLSLCQHHTSYIIHQVSQAIEHHTHIHTLTNTNTHNTHTSTNGYLICNFLVAHANDCAKNPLTKTKEWHRIIAQLTHTYTHTYIYIHTYIHTHTHNIQYIHT